jgi:hypothetical protein
MYTCTTEIRSILGKSYMETIVFKDGVVVKHCMQAITELNITQERATWEFIKLISERKLQKINQL